MAEFNGVELRMRMEERYAANEPGTDSVDYLKALERMRTRFPLEGEPIMYGTTVVRGQELQTLTAGIRGFKHRYQYQTLEKFLLDPEEKPCVCALYGLRRTGKTVLLLQALLGVANEEWSNVAYIQLRERDDMGLLYNDLHKLWKAGVKYVALDEVTAMSGFIDDAALLSDILARLGMRLMLAGTDSYGLYLAHKSSLYCRVVLIHTTFMSYKEYDYLMGGVGVDEYIANGGSLAKTFETGAEVCDYVSTSIANNLIHSLMKTSSWNLYNKLYGVCNAHEIPNLVNRLVENMNKQFALSVIQKIFKSSDLGITRKNLGVTGVLWEIDEEAVLKRLKDALAIKEYEDLVADITDKHLQYLHQYLCEIDVIVDCPIRIVGSGQEILTLFTQPGLRYNQVLHLINSLEQDPMFRGSKERETVTQKLLEEVKGRMLEDIVLYETKRSLGDAYEVLKYKFGSSDGEFDMVVYDRSCHTCRVYEIKHSSKQVPAQAKHLLDDIKVRAVADEYAEVVERCVLYLGPTDLSQPIHYRNVEEYLKELPN